MSSCTALFLAPVNKQGRPSGKSKLAESIGTKTSAIRRFPSSPDWFEDKPPSESFPRLLGATIAFFCTFERVELVKTPDDSGQKLTTIHQRDSEIISEEIRVHQHVSVLHNCPLKVAKNRLKSTRFGPDQQTRKRPSLKRWDTESTHSVLLLVPGRVDASTQRRQEKLATSNPVLTPSGRRPPTGIGVFGFGFREIKHRVAT